MTHSCFPVIEYDVDLQVAWPPCHGGSTLAVSDGARYRKMLDDFNAISAARPYLNHCTIACAVGAQVFGTTVQDLRTRPNRDVLATRQKVMAFTKVVTGASYHQIARSFDIDHSAVIRACARHELSIRLVLGKTV
ncbi:helix-turn-helix domain-containing protein [Bradyrhizobium diazoefficiens]|uniref:helix-turn-helix domain-containing protein n=1 Tax=Bradyrhizobium diazoefficiens TaxID=1355477 RepID=UPI00272DA5BF|nr:helix-turn-helix domain-containing protein [Bradyrhizobium diazoefficiens]WLA65486.1 helix-turn-helix domain-containing protein [Bradyrhizobium diazoefficiens]